METRQLRYFLEVVDSGTFTAAAERLHVAQPALWKQVKELERELGVPLFARVGRRVRLTSDGAVILPLARAAVESVNRVVGLGAELRAGRSGRVVVSCSPAHINRFLAAAGRTFRQMHPTVKLEFQERPTPAEGLPAGENVFLRDLRAGLAELAVAHDLDSEFARLKLYEISVVAIVADDHPWRNRRRLPIADLNGVPLVLPPVGYLSRGKLEAACRNAGFEPIVDFEASNPASLLAMGQEGLGIAVVSDDVPPPTDKPWPRVVSRGSELSDSAYLYWAREPRPSPAVMGFIEAARTTREAVGRTAPAVG